MNTPLPPTPESAARRAEWSAAGRPETDPAVLALHALAESAAPPATEEDVPPLPEHLRSRWEDAYRDAAEPETASLHPFVELLRRIGGVFSPSRMAWSGGLLAAALAVLLVAKPSQPLTADPTGPGVTVRGGGTLAPSGAVAPVLVIAPAGAADGLLTTLRAAFPGRTIELRESAGLTAADAGAVVIDTERRILRLASDGEPRALAIDPLTQPDSVITAIEDLEESAP